MEGAPTFKTKHKYLMLVSPLKLEGAELAVATIFQPDVPSEKEKRFIVSVVEMRTTRTKGWQIYWSTDSDGFLIKPKVI